MPYSSALPAGAEYARRYERLINIFDAAANAGAGGFVPIRRVDQIVPTMTPVQDNAQTNDDLGSANLDTSAWDWVLAFRCIAARDSATQVLVDEFKILDAAYGDAIGTAATVQVQWYHAPKVGIVGDPSGAWEGTGTVAIAPVDDGNLERWAVTITGKGPAVRIANPFDGRA